jgi:hypothetical protein
VSVKELDVGLVARNTSEESKGAQWALAGYVEGDFIGWQNGWLAGPTAASRVFRDPVSSLMIARDRCFRSISSTRRTTFRAYDWGP